MLTYRIKTLLRQTLGDRMAVYLQGCRFVYSRMRGAFREPEIDFAKLILRLGDVAVDVGACGGNWTVPLHDFVGRTGHVFAFEPYAYCARATQIALKIMGAKNVTLFSFGLSDTNASGGLRTRDSDGSALGSGNQYIDPDGALDIPGVERVQLRTLDSLVEEFPRLREMVFLKCDVEGYELSVLRGADSLLQKARPTVVLEVGEDEKYGSSASELNEFFSARSYVALIWLKTGRLGFTDRMLQRTGCEVGGNRVFIPKEKLDAMAHLLI